MGGTPGKDRTHHKVFDIPLPPYMGHQWKKIWNSKVAGFTTHTFNEDFTALTTDFVTSPPSPGGGRCYYHDKACNNGQVCCKSQCQDPKSCSYTESGCSGKYGQVHHCHWTGTD